MNPSDDEFWPSPTAFTFHIVFLHTTTNSYNLQNLRQLDKNFRVEIIDRVGFSNENVTECRILMRISYNVSVFEWDVLQCVRFWSELWQKVRNWNKTSQTWNILKSKNFQTLKFWIDDVCFCILKTKTRGDLRSRAFSRVWIHISERKVWSKLYYTRIWNQSPEYKNLGSGK